MIIAITGTPGTGKSTVAPLVADKLGYDLLDLNAFIEDHNLAESYDEDRESSMVPPEALNAALDKHATDDTVIEGHLAHYFEHADLVVILRADPDELTERLDAKGWNEEKIEENVMAERIDVILQEAANIHPDNTLESDTTARTPDEVAEEIVYMVENPEAREMYGPGGTDWGMDDMNEF